LPGTKTFATFSYFHADGNGDIINIGNTMATVPTITRGARRRRRRRRRRP